MGLRTFAPSWTLYSPQIKWEATFARIKHCPIFQGLANDAISRLADIFEEEDFEDGENIVEQGTGLSVQPFSRMMCTYIRSVLMGRF